jgi:hypothetical protein
VFAINQKSHLEISNTSLISKHNDKEEVKVDNPYFMSTLALLESKLSDLDMQLTQSQMANVDLRDCLNQEKNNNIRLMQQMRALRLEARKKDKLISKKNF